MFRRGDLIVDPNTGDVAVYAYRHDASWPDILAVATWPSGTAVHPGTRGRLYRECRGRLYRECRLFIGPIRDRAALARAVA